MRMHVSEALAIRKRNGQDRVEAMYLGGAVWRSPGCSEFILVLGHKNMQCVHLDSCHPIGMIRREVDGACEWTPDQLRVRFQEPGWKFLGFFHELYERLDVEMPEPTDERPGEAE